MPPVTLAKLSWRGSGEGPYTLAAAFEVTADIVVDLNAKLAILSKDGGELHAFFLSQGGWDVCWLPRGRYELTWTVPTLKLAPDARFVELGISARVDGHVATVAAARIDVPAGAQPGVAAGAWHLASRDGTAPVEGLAWRQGLSSWFFQHFDHASRTLVEYIGGDSPLFRGRVLDVGCGDGITALGVALRYAPVELVGVDPYRTYENLPAILERHSLGQLKLPRNLRFLPEDANALPFADDAFDAVISWAAVEHFAGGYLQALREMRRVLKPGGLLFIHPGLYYWNQGHHLAEYSKEPFFHLVKSEGEIREMVMSAKPDYADRGGDTPTPQLHWRWFKELNRITVTAFEDELRALDFEPWRVALRTDPLVEYRPGMQSYRFTEVGIAELYVSCFNRKGKPE